jgi:hypothetical protein
VLGSDFHQGLQVTQLNGSRLLLDHCGSHGQFFRCEIFALRMNDLRAALAFGLSLSRYRTDHLLGQLNLFDFNQGHLHPP